MVDKVADWRDLRLTPMKIYEGKPVWREAFLPRKTDNVVEFWLQVSGHVHMINKGLVAEAGPSEFIVCLPGTRFQRWTEDAWILSVHFALETVKGRAFWRGPHLVGLSPDVELANRVQALIAKARDEGICEDHWKEDQAMDASLPSWLELRAHLFSLVGAMLPLLEEKGVYFEPEQTRDPRIEEGIRWLLRKPVDYAFDRKEFARMNLLSPSQVDRLWRKEMKQTPRQFWEEHRLDWACRKLALESFSIKEIAFEMGFHHLSQFSTWFKKHSMESPRTFRSRHFE